MILWHNPRCTKSRQTLALLQENGVEPTIRLYLQDPPDTSEIRAVLAKLDIAPIQMMRVKEKAFKEAGLSRDSDDDTLIAAMAETPILIERPIAITDTRAAIGRPPEDVLALL
ncbi:arsenate reductase (glutaredoxin) [Pseudooceanicola atlanticus]|uniref:Arsenate reductase n=1 Tax=Pseudooceanicola atlanticus TaxID=1461694 RepID=A0A0A0EIT0_9RHOB|nr:arsenate reductase (glutaredoxin) [Pseudooceanicola atlanticus]KGM49092.1 arsenate reductase [Pseudooceanicola atlanticus]